MVCQTCNHPQVLHEHYRHGSDCALCPCTRYRRRGIIRRYLYHGRHRP